MVDKGQAENNGDSRHRNIKGDSDLRQDDPQRTARGWLQTGNFEICVVEELPSPDQTQPSHAGENNQAKPVTVQNLLCQCARGTFRTENENRKGSDLLPTSLQPQILHRVRTDQRKECRPHRVVPAE